MLEFECSRCEQFWSGLPQLNVDEDGKAGKARCIQLELGRRVSFLVLFCDDVTGEIFTALKEIETCVGGPLIDPTDEFVIICELDSPGYRALLRAPRRCGALDTTTPV